MIETLKGVLGSAIGLSRDVPPVHCSYIPPILVPLPQEMQDAIDDRGAPFLTEYVGIENLSGKVLEGARIKLRNRYLYDPVVKSESIAGELVWSYDDDRREIYVPRIDPREGIYVCLFPDEGSGLEKEAPQIIIGGQLVNKAMEWHGFLRKNPLLGVLVLVSLAAMVGAGYVSYMALAAMPSTEDREYIDQAFSKHTTCTPYVWSNEASEGIRAAVKKSPLSLPALMEINDVESWAALRDKSRVVLCE